MKFWLKKLVSKFQQLEETVESLEDDSLHFIRQVHPDLSKPNQHMNSLDEIKHSIDKIIKYMKN